nr:MAG TPA: hypothetical protein [Bacteriophage sp.]DAZ51540.1 MAG TPA: hypothetical protein [Caudoviricetes sp.]
MITEYSKAVLFPSEKRISRLFYILNSPLSRYLNVIKKI